MIWQRMCLATGLTLSCVVFGGISFGDGALAQTVDPAGTPSAAETSPSPPTPQTTAPAAPSSQSEATQPKATATSGQPAATKTDAPAAQTDSDSDSADDDQVDHSEPAAQNTKGPKVIVDVNLTTQRMHVQFPDGSEETWPIASGRPGLDTPDGHFKPQWVDPDHISKQYQDAPMPYAIFFDLKGHAIHGSYERTFGRAVSHGCVRLQVQNAKTLFAAVKANGAEINITGRARRGPGALVAEGHGRYYRGYRYAYGQRYAYDQQGGYWPYGSGYSYGYQQSYQQPQHSTFFGFFGN